MRLLTPLVLAAVVAAWAIAAAAASAPMPQLPDQPDGTLRLTCDVPLVVLAYDYDPPRDDEWRAVEIRLPRDPRPFLVYLEGRVYIDLDGDGQADETMSWDEWQEDPRDYCDVADGARERRR